MRRSIQAKAAKASIFDYSESQLTCESEIIDAFDAKEIFPHFQPILCLKTRKLLGVEVLARWNHPKHGLVLPHFFLGLIKSQGLHQKLFFCLFEQALTLHSYLHSIGESLIFSYNIEADQLSEIDFATELVLRINDARVPVNQVVLEVTEKENLVLDSRCSENLEHLINNGVRLSLDDFGTGHSSIMRLGQIPFSQIKLDADFVAQAHGDKHTRIIECVVNLARVLCLELVAEGVESEEQCAHLVKLGVEKGQGYLFHKPMHGSALLALILADRCHSSYDFL